MSNPVERTQDDQLSVGAQPVCVVVDANNWHSSALLRSPIAVALVYYLRQSGGYLGMPQVLEREWNKRAAERIDSELANYKQAAQTIETMCGFKANYVHLTAAELEEIRGRCIAELRDLFVPVPFTLEHAWRALDRVDAGLPPNRGKNQQFKDSAIWEAVLELARAYRVCLVSNDVGFYEGDYTGLANKLTAECSSLGVNVRVFRDISSCLKHLKQEKPVDFVELEWLADVIEGNVGDSLLSEASEQRGYFFSLDRIAASAMAHLTDKRDRLAIAFELTYRLINLSDSDAEVRLEPKLTLRGDCFYDTNTKEVSDIRVPELQVSFCTVEGNQVTQLSPFNPSGIATSSLRTVVSRTMRMPLKKSD